MLAAQLFATVQAQESAKLQAADVQLADGSTLCSVPGTQNHTSGNPTGTSSQQYYISTDGHRLLALSATMTGLVTTVRMALLLVTVPPAFWTVA